MKSAPVGKKVRFDPFRLGTVANFSATTPAQREIWAAAQLSTDASCSYNQVIRLRLSGSFSIDAFRSAVAEIIDRHESLRGGISLDGKTFVVSTSVETPLTVSDLSKLTASEQVAALEKIVNEQSSTPFDLATPPLLRVTVITLGPTETEILLCAHHVIVDGWSMGVILHSLSESYGQKDHGHVSQRSDSSFPGFCDFVDWYNADAQNKKHRESISYWKSVFSATPPVLELPTEVPRPAQRSFECDTLEVTLNADAVAAFKKMAAERRSTFFSGIFSAFAVLLHKISGQDDFVIGVPAAGQSLIQQTMLVGHCTNMLPIRVGLDPSESFASFLEYSRKVVLESMQHQYCSYSELLPEVRLARDTSRPPLVPIMLNVDRTLGTLAFGNLETNVSAAPRRYDNFEWTANIVETEDSTTLALTYNDLLYSRESMRHRAREFERLLVRVSSDPDCSLDELSIVSSESRTRQLEAWNATERAYPSESLIECLSAGMLADSTASAVYGNGESLSYAELEQRSNALAHYLRSKGAGRGAFVGLHLERSPQIVVALLGILKSGAAYLPLDPSFPADRLAFMLEDSGAKLLVSESSLSGSLSFDGETVLLDSDKAAIADAGDTPLDVGTTAEDLAYVIYTSGSTGKPKGVQVAHGNAVNFLHSMAREPGIEQSDRLLAVTTLSFDISVLEIFLPLYVGATVVVANQAEVIDGGQLHKLIKEQGITIMQATPATWRLLLASGWAGDQTLKVLCGGEALPRDLAADLLEHAGEIWNMYGPTETTVWSTCYRITDADAPILIGRPIDNTQIYVLDEAMNPVPEGVFGELYIGGDGVTPGYLNRPELNSERFIANPFVEGGRMYRTGDLVRYRPQGLLEYGHRADNQVKVRGFRIELGEIESALAAYPHIGETVVIVREDQPGDQRLVAYYAHDGDAPNITQLRKHLRKSLPDYMIPQHFVPLEVIPKTPNNKIDRNALPAIQQTNGSAQTNFVEPKNSTEQKIADYWRELLKASQVGRTDNFFDLGGHSLLSMQVIAWAKREYNVSIYPLTLITDNLAQIASFIDEQSPTTDATSETRAPKESIVRRWLGALRGIGQDAAS